MSSREYSARDGGGRDRDRDRDRDYDRNRGGRYDDPRRDRDRGRDNSYRSNRGGDRERERGHDRDRDRPRDRDDHRDHGRDRYNGGSRSEGGDRHAREEQPTNAQPPREDDKPPQQSTSSSGWDAKKEAENDPTWARIYISNLPTDITSDELQELFGSLGVVAREKQKRGYKDQWPFKIKVYTDDAGQVKGDAVLTYEDANAARAAPSFFDGK
ncbi:hypothetical protein Poli38472_005143 [Pythium oligandrum]|uniref:RRM domain-containing protein n=1 Tax=Pythium oligandrum TaxID=41045 RepID=A0A8K1CGY4_PYTOL|nr:hypothetical protein Poli38472_005143 [Pythium oligandrum]|eukprot:TMW62525.1 hypothetical protein Poli38472_005143 [Pythium oligandrum]